MSRLELSSPECVVPGTPTRGRRDDCFRLGRNRCATVSASPSSGTAACRDYTVMTQAREHTATAQPRQSDTGTGQP